MSHASKRLAQFEKELLVIDKTKVRSYSSFEEAERVDWEYWRSKTPLQRMQALEHIRQLAWGYDEASRPPFEKIIRVFQLGDPASQEVLGDD